MFQNKQIKIFVPHIPGEVCTSIQDNEIADLSTVAVAADTLYFTGGKYTFKGGDTDSRGN
jgi:hypothetical protein